MNKKQLYAAPETEVLELRLEGTVLSGSPESSMNPSINSALLEDGSDW